MKINELRKNPWPYLEQLKFAVDALLPKQVSLTEDRMSGTWSLWFEACDLDVMATPHYDAHECLPVQQYDTEGMEVVSFELPFKLAGDLEADAAEYVRQALLIPAILGLDRSTS